MKRAQTESILRDLEKKMVFIAGPRQAGKTWLAKSLMSSFKNALYLNYDQVEHLEIIHHQQWIPETELVIFDELHKMPNWKQYLKGVFDTKKNNLRILVTGSARLEAYRKFGDSLAGRYFLHHLLPLSLAELNLTQQPGNLDHFLNRGGFPEPFLATTDLDAARWRKQYIESLLSTDIFEFNTIQNSKAIRLLFELLRRRVGSPISYQSLAGDLGISSVTVKKYIEVLEALYVVFRVTPYSNNIARSILKEPKIYFFDTGLVMGSEGAILENFVATSLFKQVCGEQDYLAEESQLHYLRDKEGHEVDFVLVKNDMATQLIEVKLSDGTLSPSLLYFKKKYDIPSIQIVKNLKQELIKMGIKILNAQSFLSTLYL